MDAKQAYRSESQEAVRDVRRRAAVAAATELFADRGFHAAGMADIARDAGLSLKAMYDSFASKEALFTAVLEDVGARFAVLFEAPESELEPPQRLLGFIDRLLGLIEQNTAFLRLYQRGADGVPAVLRDVGIDPFAATTERLYRDLAAIVLEAQARGSAPGLDPNLVARMLPTIVVEEARRRLDAGEPASMAAGDLHAVFGALLRPRPPAS
jgi:AcrR family transcriptional regulator